MRLLVQALGLTALLFLAASTVWAAVTIADFYVEAGEVDISVFWETASEIGNLGFYVWRSETELYGYQKLPLDAPEAQFIPSEDFGVGAFYTFVDVQVTPGILYYYKVQDVPADGSLGGFVGPEAAGIDVTPTQTPTPTATPTDTPTPTSTPTPEPTQPTTPEDPVVKFWAEPTQVQAGDCATVQWQTANVQAVFLDGVGVSGQGARSFCPCESETHVLNVRFLDGSARNYEARIEVTGTCGSDARPSPSDSVLPTPTLSATPRRSPTPESVLGAGLTRTPSTATPRPRVTTEARTQAESPLPTSRVSGLVPEPDSPLPSPSSDPALGVTSGPPEAGGPEEGIVEGGATRDEGYQLWVLVALMGLGLLVGGFWLWKRG